MDHILISLSARVTEVCTSLDNEPTAFWARALFFVPRLWKEEARTKYIWEAITDSDLMCWMYNINHVVWVIDKLQQRTRGSCSATFNEVWRTRKMRRRRRNNKHAKPAKQRRTNTLKGAMLLHTGWGQAGHGAGGLIFSPLQATPPPPVYQDKQLQAFSPCSPFWISCAAFSLSRFRFYVIFFFFFFSPDCVVNLCNRTACCSLHMSVCVWACTLCKCRSFQTPIGVQSPNQLTAQVLILSAHKLLFLFLISNEHICTDICFFISFLSRPQEGMWCVWFLFFQPYLTKWPRWASREPVWMTGEQFQAWQPAGQSTCL